MSSHSLPAWSSLTAAVVGASLLTQMVLANTPGEIAPATAGVEAKAAEVAIDPATERLVAGFLKSLGNRAGVTAEQRKEVEDLARRQLADPATRELTITESLRALYPDFASALVALGEENTEAALSSLRELSKSDDPYLAAEAKFFLARTHIMEERFEEALPLLDELIVESEEAKTLYAGEALFLKGISHSRLLDRDPAKAALEKFLANYPAASERLRVGAKLQLEELKLLEQGSIADVQDRMQYSRRRLDLQRTDDPTQKEQATIIAMLDKLIEEAEERECNCQGSGSGSGRGRGGIGGANPGAGAQHSGTRLGSAETGPLSRLNRGKMDEGWGAMRDKQRDEVLSALKGKYPDRYKQLVEQYYKSLQDEE